MITDKESNISLVPMISSSCRILLTEPRLVLMDESTSALDTDNEAFLYGSLQKAGIRYVSIGHRPTLADFHSKVLRLSTSQEANEGGSADAAIKCTWEVYPSDREQSRGKQLA